jgi:hypothetical protein
MTPRGFFPPVSQLRKFRFGILSVATVVLGLVPVLLCDRGKCQLHRQKARACTATTLKGSGDVRRLFT